MAEAMFTKWRKSQHWWDPEVRENLLNRLRRWLAEAQDDDEISLARRDVETAESALADALRDIPKLEKKLEALLWQDARAKRALKDNKGKERLYEACRIKGWLPQSGKATKYPPLESLVIEHQYVALTTGAGQVTLGDSIAECLVPGDPSPVVIDELLNTVDGCPLDPWDAVKQLALLYEAASPQAMLKELWSRRKEIELKRQERLGAGETSAAEALPDLSSLPQQRDIS